MRTGKLKDNDQEARSQSELNAAEKKIKKLEQEVRKRKQTEEALLNAIDGLEAGGGTDLSAGLNTAYDIAATSYIQGGITADPGPKGTDLIKDDAGLAISTPVTLHWEMTWESVTGSEGGQDHGGLWQDDDTYACRLVADGDSDVLTVAAKCDNAVGSSCVLVSDMSDEGIFEHETLYDVRLYYDTSADDCTIEIGDCSVTCNGSSTGVLVDGWAMGTNRSENNIVVDSIGLCAGAVQAGVKCGD